MRLTAVVGQTTLVAVLDTSLITGSAAGSTAVAIIP